MLCLPEWWSKWGMLYLPAGLRYWAMRCLEYLLLR
jgi:hypothetical protein